MMPNTITLSRRARQRAHLRFALLAGAWLAMPAAARAQTRFEWPKVAVQLDHYRTVDECLAITARVRDSVAQRSGVWSDTVPLTAAVATAPLAAPVAAVAQRCAARFDATTAALDDFQLLLPLYLLAGRDADAATLVARRLGAVSPTAKHERSAVLDTAIRAYVTREGLFSPQPPRLAAAEQLVAALVKNPAASWSERYSAYAGLLDGALLAADTARARRAAEGVVAAVAAAPEEERSGAEYDGAVQASFQALGVLHEAVLLDSLRRSTAGYVALRRADWSKASGEFGRALHLPIGEQAPPVHGDFWFGRGTSTAPRPTKGSVALVVFLDQRVCMGGAPQCWVAYSILGRLARRFPELEVTLVAQTHGYLGAMVPPPPAAEADSLRAWWLEKHHLPGALAVTNTDFWRLQDPDRRRIERTAANKTSYTFGPRWPAGGAYLVDRSGTIVDVVAPSDASAELRVSRLIAALFAQQTASR